MFYRFRSHPSPGIFENGRLVTVDTQGKTSVIKKVKADADTSSGYGAGGFGEVGGTGGYGGMIGAGGGSAPMNDLYNPVWDRLEQGTVLEDWIPRDAAGLDQMFMLMYHRCPIAGTIVDLIADTIWSDYDLVGITDPAIRDVYENSMQAIDVLSTMPDITREYLVLGRSISSLIFDKDKGIFKDLISHDPSLVRLTPIPIKGFDPKIDLIPSPRFREFVDSQDPRDIDARKLLPPAYINAVRNMGAAGGVGLGWGLPSAHSTGSQNIAGIPLDPVNTLFIARRVFNYDTVGTSLYTRLISFWALEKALINATVTSARRRIRSILHVKAGIDNLWEASAAELDNLASMFIQAEQDPVGAVVVTRTGVDATELRQGNDFYKWSDEWSMLTEGKLRALGANDALLSGDATYSNQESARMFFMEKALNLRNVLTKRIYYNRMFPLIARIHGFVKRSQAELDHRVRLTQREAMSIPQSDLIMPTIAWKKELVNTFDEKRMEMLEKMEEKNVPITLRSWAAAANFNVDGELAELENDAALRKKITQWKAQFDPEASDKQAQLDMADNIRNLAQSNLQKVVGSAMEDLGHLRNFLFWDREGRFAGVPAVSVSQFIKNIDPNSNNVRILVDPAALRVALGRHFKNDLDIEVGHYLLFRSGLTSLKPVLSKKTQAAVCDALKISADNYAGQHGLYELFRLIESEVQLVMSLDYQHKESGFSKLNKTLDKIPLPVRDPMPASSPALFSGKDKV